MGTIPNPETLHPVSGHPRVVFLKPLVQSPKIIVGEYTYYDDPDDPTGFERNNVLYAYGPERRARSRAFPASTAYSEQMAQRIEHALSVAERLWRGIGLT